MFSFSRQTMTLDQAVSKLANRIISYDPESKEIFAQEPVFVVFFAIFFCLKFTRHRSWKRDGREIFDRLTSSLHEYLNVDFLSDILNANKIQERMSLYSLAIEIATDNPSPANVAYEIGVSFAMVHGEEGNDNLIQKGADIFTKETEAMFDLFKEYKIV